MPFKAFIDQCKKRKILKGFSIYALVSWVIIQVAATTFPYLHIPGEAVTYIIMMVLLGLPISILFSWYYNVVPDDQKIPDQKKQINTNKKVANLFLILIIGLAIIVLTIISFLLNRNFEKTGSVPNIDGEERIAVLEFSNFVTEPGFEKLGKAAANWISHGLIEYDIARVITPQIIEDYNVAIEASLIPSKRNVVKDILAAEKIIEGSISKDGQNLIFKCTIKNGITGEFLEGFEDVVVDASEPIKGIEALKSKVLGYFATESNPLLKLQDDPPKYEAYLLILDAKDLDITDSTTLNLINKALIIDSSYFEAKVLRIAHYYNKQNYSKADSLRKLVEPNSKSNLRQKNLLNWYSALLAGKNKLIYETWKNEFKYAPFDLTTNQTMMSIALQFVFKPQEIESIFDEVKATDLNIESCVSCKYRIYVKAVSDIEKGEFKNAISLLEPHITINSDNFILKPLISAYIRSGSRNKLDKLFKDLPNLIIERDWSDLYLFAAKEFLLKGDSKSAEPFLELGIEAFKNKEKRYELAQAYLYQEDFTQVIQILEKMNNSDGLSTLNKAKLAFAYHKTNQTEKAVKIQKEIENISNTFDFGMKEYILAYLEAQKGNNDLAFEYLLNAVQRGYIYGFEEFQNELAFISLSKEDRFKEILGYWH